MKNTRLILFGFMMWATPPAFSQYVNIQNWKGKPARVYVSKAGIAYPYFSSLKEAKKVYTSPEDGQILVTGNHPNYNYWQYKKSTWVKIPKL